MTTNQELYQQKQMEYPYELISPRFDVCRLSPSDFGAAHPEIKFCEIPLEDGMHWMFYTKEDFDTFKRWAKYDKAI